MFFNATQPARIYACASPPSSLTYHSPELMQLPVTLHVTYAFLPTPYRKLDGKDEPTLVRKIKAGRRNYSGARFQFLCDYIFNSCFVCLFLHQRVVLFCFLHPAPPLPVLAKLETWRARRRGKNSSGCSLEFPACCQARLRACPVLRPPWLAHRPTPPPLV